MNKQQIFEWFYHNSSSLSSKRIIGIFAVGLLIALIIYTVYRITYRGVAYNSRFNTSNIAILLITIVLMLMISSNIVISMGMVGALSIVRFRTAIKDPRDTVFIFWSIAEGLCIGSQNNRLAIISTLIIAIVIVASTYGINLSKKYLLILRTKESITEKNISDLLKPYVIDCKMRNVHKNGEMIEMIFEVKVKKNLDETILKELLEYKEVSYMNWLLESGEMIG